MSEHAVIVDAIFVVRWSREFTPTEVQDVVARLIDTRRAVRHPLVLVVINDSCKLPSRETLEALLRGVPAVAHTCSCAYGVVAAEEPARRILVGWLEAFGGLTAMPSEVCDTLEVALRHAARAVRIAPESVIDFARRSAALAPLLATN